MRIFLLLFSLLFTSQLWAEIQWVGNEQAYQLKASTLFKLRKELSKEEKTQLKAVRNVKFSSLTQFTDALDKSIGKQHALTAKLIEKATLPAVSYGFESRKPLLTLVVSDGKHQLDQNSFTQQSWLKLPALDNNKALTATFNNQCLQVFSVNELLFELCGGGQNGEQKSAYLKTDASSILGLGQEFVSPEKTDANRLGFTRHGKNTMSGFNGGYNGNTLLPIAYFDFPAEQNKQPFALILDNRYPQNWDFSEAPYKLSVDGGDLKLHVLTGENLADIRRDYMQMAGTPLLPPKSAFGLWLSEYGYDNWAELDDKIATLKENDFPFSGVVMDLQWFGGISEDEHSKMGSLTWDLENFPNPKKKIANYKKDNIDMIVIEESYITKGLEEYKVLDEKGFLAHDNNGNSLDVTEDPAWWGHGGMFDWSNKAAGDFWHEFRRQDLIDAGVAGHWTDLGEPEMHNTQFKYSNGLDHEMIHNSYNLLWLQSIYDGYLRNEADTNSMFSWFQSFFSESEYGQRPFMMSRSGGIGMQALGAVIWSGDIGSDFGSLAAQMPQQTHMMWSGIDYYSSDVGGFHRSALKHSDKTKTKKELMDELYTQWFAYSSLYEVPVRAHTENLCNCKETTPDRIGDTQSNLANINLRYQLLPYYYSLAYSATLLGEPVFPSLEYYYPNDTSAKNLGDVKMIGPFLVGASASKPGQTKSATYLPEGEWFDFRTGEKIRSTGQWIEKDLYLDKLFNLPLFVKQGALIPEQINQENSLKVFGFGELSFDWYDDDGFSTAYLQGNYQQIKLQGKQKQLLLTRIKGSQLTIKQVEWILPTKQQVKAVTSNAGKLEFEQTGSTLVISLPEFKQQLDLQLTF